MKANERENVVFKQPTTFDERRGVAKLLVERFHYKLPLAIDGLDNRAGEVFAGWPERVYVIDRGGKIVYKGEMGPFGFHPEEAAKVLGAKRG
jgi:type I thyroxine 5'-deiodinase